MYNLDVGEHYYQPMTSYLEAERGTRGETPGALTFEERLAQRWLHGRRYEATADRDRYARASSLARGEAAAATASAASGSSWQSEMASRASRSASEMRTASTTAARAASEMRYASSRAETQSQATSKQQMISQSMASTTQKTEKSQLSESVKKSALAQEQRLSSAFSQKKATSASQRQETEVKTQSSSRRIDDDICKKVADIHMSPWSAGQELNEANNASARARARILELEKELEEITRKAMTTQVRAIKTAKQMAAEATLEDEQAMKSSYKKSKKVMIESSSKMG